jgi:hypothetical protein
MRASGFSQAIATSFVRPCFTSLRMTRIVSNRAKFGPSTQAASTPPEVNMASNES